MFKDMVKYNIRADDLSSMPMAFLQMTNFTLKDIPLNEPMLG